MNMCPSEGSSKKHQHLGKCVIVCVCLLFLVCVCVFVCFFRIGSFSPSPLKTERNNSLARGTDTRIPPVCFNKTYITQKVDHDLGMECS